MATGAAPSVACAGRRLAWRGRRRRRRRRNDPGGRGAGSDRRRASLGVGGVDAACVPCGSNRGGPSLHPRRAKGGYPLARHIDQRSSRQFRDGQARARGGRALVPVTAPLMGSPAIAEIRRAAQALCGQIGARIEAQAVSRSDVPAPDDYAALLRRPSERAGFKRFCDGLHAAEAAIRAGDEALAALYNRFLAAAAVRDFDPSACPWPLPPAVIRDYEATMARIITTAETGADAAFTLDADPFAKDMALLTFRLLPMGCFVVEPSARLHLRGFRAGGWRSLLRAAWVVLAVTRGRDGFLFFHLHRPVIAQFTPDALVPAHLAAAAFVRLNRGCRGLLGASWLLDPVLDAISPRVGTMRRMSEAGDAWLVDLGPDDPAKTGALVRSETRRRLHAEGKYTPRIYCRIWPRRALLAWAVRQEAPAAIGEGRLATSDRTDQPRGGRPPDTPRSGRAE